MIGWEWELNRLYVLLDLHVMFVSKKRASHPPLWWLYSWWISTASHWIALCIDLMFDYVCSNLNITIFEHIDLNTRMSTRRIVLLVLDIYIWGSHSNTWVIHSYMHPSTHTPKLPSVQVHRSKQLTYEFPNIILTVNDSIRHPLILFIIGLMHVPRVLIHSVEIPAHLRFDSPYLPDSLTLFTLIIRYNLW